VSRIDFEGPSWYKNAKADGAVDKGIKGSVTLPTKKKKATGTFESGYEDDKPGAQKTKSNYTFTTDPQKPGKPKEGKEPPQKHPFEYSTEIDPEHSLDYDAATGLLSIHDDRVVGTPSPADPLLGAMLSFPDFRFAGIDVPRGLAVFWAVGDTPLTVARGADVFQRSAVPVLFYDLADNRFYARLGETALAGMSADSPFHDATLSELSSPHLDAVAGALDPASPDYDPAAGLFMTITPDADLAALTNGFSATAHAGGRDLHFVSSVPEPPAPSLLAAGLAALGAAAVRRGRAAQSRRKRYTVRDW
jgi:hypothetical protein